MIKRAFEQPDTSGPVLEYLLSQGYTEARWIINTNRQTRDVCDTLHLHIFNIADLLRGLQAGQPIYETTHPGCKCSLQCYKRDEQGNPILDPTQVVMVSPLTRLY